MMPAGVGLERQRRASDLNNTGEGLRPTEDCRNPGQSFAPHRPHFQAAASSRVADERNDGADGKVHVAGRGVAFEQKRSFPQFRVSEVGNDRIKFPGREALKYGTRVVFLLCHTSLKEKSKTTTSKIALPS